VIDGKGIVEPPLNGRNCLAPALLTAGAVQDNLGRTAGEGGLSASGQHRYQVNVTVDGLDKTTRLRRPALLLITGCKQYPAAGCLENGMEA